MDSTLDSRLLSVYEMTNQQLRCLKYEFLRRMKWQQERKSLTPDDIFALDETISDSDIMEFYGPWTKFDPLDFAVAEMELGYI